MMVDCRIYLADGFEEGEAILPADLLRRAGLSVSLTSVEESLEVRSARGFVLHADESIRKTGPAHWHLLPGGKVGTDRLRDSADLRNSLEAARKRGEAFAAVCAAPSVLASWGWLRGERLTSHESVREAFAGVAEWTDQTVVDAGWLVTSRGLGTTMEFAFTLVARTVGSDKARFIADSIHWNGRVPA